jgi:hypothetical protein
MVGISDGNPCTFSSSKNRFMYYTTQKRVYKKQTKRITQRSP